MAHARHGVTRNDDKTVEFGRDGRWRAYDYDALVAPDKANLDIFWIGDESLEETANLPEPEVLAALRGSKARAAKASPATEEAGAEDQEQATPPCPRCGAPMVVREVKQEGPRQGQRFWGCPNFPKCRGTQELEDTAAGTQAR